jgi:hypothetical protein
MHLGKWPLLRLLVCRTVSIMHSVFNTCYSLLADSADHPASPPSTNASPALTKASLASEEKKEA